MNNKPPRISVIMPAYNIDRYILRALSSVTSQNLGKDEYELIVVNDGSTDQTRQIVEHFILTHPDLQSKLFNTENRGVSEARNLGLVKARGEYILFLDGDDFIDRSMLSDILNEVVNQMPDIIICGYTRVNEDGVIMEEDYSRACDFPHSTISGINMLRDIYKNGEHYRIWTGSIIYRRRLIEKSRIFYTPGCTHAEDIEFQIKAIANASSVVFIPKVLSWYRQRYQSAVRTYNKQRLIEHFSIQRAADYLDTLKMSELNGTVSFLRSYTVFTYIQNNINAYIDSLVMNKGLSLCQAIVVARSDLLSIDPDIFKQIKIIVKLISNADFSQKIFAFNMTFYTYLRLLKKFFKA